MANDAMVLMFGPGWDAGVDDDVRAQLEKELRQTPTVQLNAMVQVDISTIPERSWMLRALGAGVPIQDLAAILRYPESLKRFHDYRATLA